MKKIYILLLFSLVFMFVSFLVSSTHEIVCEVNFTYEKTDIGIIREKISETAKSVGVNLTSYDIKRLQEVFNISLK